MKYTAAACRWFACFKPSADQAPAIQAPDIRAPAIQAPAIQAPAIQAPADQTPAIQPKLFDFGNLPKDLLFAIADLVKDPRDLRSFSLAVSIADVPTKEINDHIMAIVQYNLEFGRIYTRQSPYIKHYKAIEGELNPRTNKPFKFDTIAAQEGWQDDPDWQSWNWTNVKEVYFEWPSVDPKHAKLPLTRLNGLKKIHFNYLKTDDGFDIALELLIQNREVEILKIRYDPSIPSQLVQTVCSLENLKDLALLYSKTFIEEVLTCLPADKLLEKLEICDFLTSNARIVATPDIFAKLRVNQLSCTGCDSKWIDLPEIQKLEWVFGKNHDETVSVLKKLESMETPLPYLRLVQYMEAFEPRAFQLIREIAPRFNEMEIYYDYQPSEEFGSRSRLIEKIGNEIGNKLTILYKNLDDETRVIELIEEIADIMEKLYQDQNSEDFSRDFQPVREILDEMKIFYKNKNHDEFEACARELFKELKQHINDLRAYTTGRDLLKQLPDFQDGESPNEYLKKGKQVY